jgi:hypothetical protein
MLLSQQALLRQWRPECLRGYYCCNHRVSTSSTSVVSENYAFLRITKGAFHIPWSISFPNVFVVVLGSFDSMKSANVFA